MLRKSSLLALAATGALLASGVAHATPILTLSPVGTQSNQAAPRAAEADFLATLNAGFVTETFESIALGTQGSPLSTAVGDFSQVVAGTGGACTGVLGGCAGGVAILSSANSPFSGRFNTTVGGGQWLDSFDSQELLFAPKAGVNAVGFYITDPNDAGGRFTISLASGTTVVDFGQVFGGALANGRLFYLSFVSTEDILGITIFSNNRNDGFGIDDVTVGRVPVPAPGALGLLGLGLLGMGLARRRVR